MERYSHTRMEAKRKVVETLRGKDFEPGVAYWVLDPFWTQLLIVISNKSNDDLL